MTFKPGKVNDFADSMAKAMEDAFKKEWSEVKGIPLPEEGEEDRRLFMSAIAQGVIRHLKDHAEEALQITVNTTQNESDIISEGSIGGIGAVTVEQRNTSSGSNRVVSEGEGKIADVKTEGLYP